MSAQPLFEYDPNATALETFSMADMKEYLGEFLGLTKRHSVKDVTAERVVDYTPSGTFIEEGVRGTVTLQGVALDHDTYIYDVYKDHNPFSPAATEFLSNLAMEPVPIKIVHPKLPITRTVMAPQHPRVRTIMGTRLFHDGLGFVAFTESDAQ